MPTSAYAAIPSVLSFIQQLGPKSILDIGVGFGKWGFLFREYTDIAACSERVDRYEPDKWQVRIEGIEAHEAYLSPVHAYVYDAIHVGDALEVIPKLGEYDVIFLGDVLEHFTEQDGADLIRHSLGKGRYVLLTTPRFPFEQGALCDNPFEIHRSYWSPRDFRRIAPVEVFKLPQEILLVIYRRQGEARIRPRLERPRSAIRALLRTIRLGRRFKRSVDAQR